MQDKFDDVDRQREDMEAEVYKMEKERDEAIEERSRWQQQAEDVEARVGELEQEAKVSRSNEARHRGAIETQPPFRLLLP